MAPKQFSRRHFLKSSALAATVPFILPAFGRGKEPSPNDRIQLGIIGMGMMGGRLLNGFLREETVQVVAVCDVDADRLDHHRQRANQHYAEKTGRGNFDGCAGYGDYRALLARDDVDGVVIATPDHWHAIMAIEAARSGKAIYCEKPLCQSVEEALALVRTVRRHRCVFQTGSQQRSDARFRRACEWVRNGWIGRVERVEVALPDGIATWCALPESDPPAALDWDLWLGPAPERGWNETLSPTGVHRHFPDWRLYREYGGGMITDWGAHHLDIVQWGLDADDSGPERVLPPEEIDATTGARLIYPRGIEVTHVEGNGITFFGTEGRIFVNRTTLESTPEFDPGEPLPDDAVRLYESDHHLRNWLDCIRSREKPICDVDVGARSVIACHLVNMAYWYREAFDWDPAENRLAHNTGNPDWLEVAYRSPWKLEEQARSRPMIRRRRN